MSTVAMAARAIERDERILDLIRGKTQRQVEEILAARSQPAERREVLRPAAGRDGPVWEFAFAARPEFREKFERVRAILSRKHPEGVSQEQVFEAALDEYLKGNDPARPVVERSLRGSDGARRSRCIPAAARRAVWRRDGGRCAFVGPNGRRCGSTWDVEVDHVKPFCRGGEHRVENLRLLCSAHNRRQAERDLGTAWMAPFCRRE